jgi:hypothetical protein
MNQRDIAAMMAAVAPVIRDFCAKTLDGLTSRLKTLEDRAPLKGDQGAPGKDGQDGKDVNPELIEQIVASAVEKLPAPKDGAAGKDADPAIIAQLVAEAVAKIPAAKDGIDGKDADPSLIERVVADAVAKFPAVKDGLDGKDADPAVIAQLVAEAVAKIPAAKDGIDGKDSDPELITRLVAEATAKIPAPKDGAPGRDGRDAADLSILKDMLPALVKDGVVAILSEIKISSDDDGRTLIVGIPIGGKAISQSIKTATVLDRGVWRARDEGYEKGDGVSFGGSFWIAQIPTKNQPDTDDSGWRLAVKRGRDGRDGKQGGGGPKGDKGDPGRDGRTL